DVATHDVDAERKWQPGLRRPPLTEIEGLREAFRRIRELSLVNQQSGLAAPVAHLLEDLLEVELAIGERAAQGETEHEERGRQRPGHDDLEVAELLDRPLRR